MNKLFFILALLLAVSMTANGQRYLRSGGVSGGRPSMTPTTTIGDAPDDASDSVVDDSPAANTPVVKPDTRPEGNASTGNNSSNNNNNNSSNNNSSNNNTSTPKPTTNTTANNTSTPKPTTNTTTPKPTTNTTTNNTSTPKPTTNTTTNNTSTPKPTTNTTTNNTSTPKPTTNTTTTTPKPTTNSTSTNSSSSSSNSSSSNSSSSSSSNSSSSSSSSSSTVSAFAATCLKGHNEERASLGIAPLKWSTTLAKAAQSWADTIASRGQLDHSDNRVHVGENTARRTYKSGVDSAELLVGQWLDEKKYFKKGNYPNISTTGSTSDVGHYSAMIWAKTTELGCGIARAGGRDYLVCQYAESGNRHGKPVY